MKVLNFILLIFLLIGCSSKNIVEQKNENINKECQYFYIPFDYTNGYIIITINLKHVGEIKMLVDNGCHDIVFIEEFIKEYLDTLNLKLYPNRYSFSRYVAVTNQKTYLAVGDIVLSYKDTIFKNINSNMYFSDKKNIGEYVYVLENGKINSILKKEKISGILPLRILAQKGILKIDFQNKRIEFPDRLNKKDLIEYNCITKNGVQYIKYPIQIKEETVHSFIFNTLFDLGNPMELIVYVNNRTKELKNFISKKYINISQQKYNYQESYFPTLLFGKDSIILNDIYTSFMPEYDNFMDLNIGLGILSEYILYFDYLNNKIYTYSDKKEIKLSNDSIYLNIHLMPTFPNMLDSKYYISGIIDTTDMLLKLRDTIISINNIMLSGLKVDSISKLLKGNKIGKNSITIKRNGKQMTLFDVKRKRK